MDNNNEKIRITIIIIIIVVDMWISCPTHDMQTIVSLCFSFSIILTLFWLHLIIIMSSSSINSFCPWSGKPIEADDSLTSYKGYLVGFCNRDCRDKFAKAVVAFDAALENHQHDGRVANSVCPWSGNPINEDSLTEYRGLTIGFCNPGCRDKFATAISVFEEALSAQKK